MSASSEIVDSCRLPLPSHKTPPEKSNFSQTCNLLSQYLKEKGTFGDLTLGLASPAMNLFPAKQQVESAQMTIFYGGQVMVFDDLAAEKAKEIIMLAEKGAIPKPVSVETCPSKPKNVFVDLQRRSPSPVVSDLPIARKNSLTRFLEKRKDRISGRAPYQVASQTQEDSSGSKSPWLGMGLGAVQVQSQSQSQSPLQSQSQFQFQPTLSYSCS